jgi:threonine/homoserine/homoserine lactone efflux protein
MPHLGAFSLFLLAALILAVTPGPAVLYIVTRSVSQGRTAGVVSCLGIALGTLVHVVAAALGLSAVLASSALAFSLVKYAGAAYLIWLGCRKLLREPDSRALAPVEARSLRRVFWEGVVVNVLNPKTALFFLAFLPQFVDASAGPAWYQLLILGGAFALVAFCTDCTWGLLAGSAGAWLKSHPRFPQSERYVSGSVYVGLGLATAFAGSGRK